VCLLIEPQLKILMCCLNVACAEDSQLNSFDIYSRTLNLFFHVGLCMNATIFETIGMIISLIM